MAFARYGNAAIAERHLEQLTNAVLRVGREGETDDPASPFGAEIDAMAEASEAAYTDLVRTPGFVGFFRRVTPIDGLAALPIGSRPVARSADDVHDLDDLRAIPWVFAWAQSRVNLPGMVRARAPDWPRSQPSGTGPARLRRMHHEWPFFDGAARERGAVAREGGCGHRRQPATSPAAIAPTSRRRSARSGTAPSDLVLAVTAVITAGSSTASRSCRARSSSAAPYVDALSFLQLRFLNEPRGTAADRLVQATIGGVAAGLQNTGYRACPQVSGPDFLLHGRCAYARRLV